MLQAAVIAAVTISGARAAHADATAECAKAYEQVQGLRREGKLLEARKQALFCAADACPALLTKDCTKWAGELEQAIPSVSLEARGPDGAVVTDVKVLVDGEAVSDALDGRPLRVNPGSHTLRFEHGALPPIEHKILVHESDRARKLLVRFRSEPERERPVPVVTWVFGAISVVSLAGGAYFALSGLGRKGDLDDSGCAPRCGADEVNAMSRNLALGDVLLGIGLVSGAAAVTSYVLRPTVDVVPAASGAAVTTSLRGTF